MVQGVDEAAVSDSGTLIYTLGVQQETDIKYTLAWVDKGGKEELLDAPPNPYNQPKISPDGTRVAFVVGSYPNEDIYVWDIARKNLNKLTLDVTRELMPIWTPDSKRIIYWSTHEVDPQGGIYWRAADGSGKVEKLCSASDRQLFPWSISRDGKSLLTQELVTFENADIGMLNMESDHERKQLLHEEYSEAQPTISPDGQWMAYCSSESTGEWNRPEVYIRPFPEVEESKTQVSSGGGHSPRWSPDGEELYYLSNENDFMVVSVETEPSLSLGTPKILFQSTNLGLTSTSGTPYDVHPDGKRFLMIKPPAGAEGTAIVAGPRKITVVVNWIEELKQRVPVD
jgi:Tol biopolymer transport system component